jgi:hypothetical protein
MAPRNKKVTNTVPLMSRLIMKNPIQAWLIKAVIDPISKASLPNKFFLPFFSVTSILLEDFQTDE